MTGEPNETSPFTGQTGVSQTCQPGAVTVQADGRYQAGAGYAGGGQVPNRSSRYVSAQNKARLDRQPAGLVGVALALIVGLATAFLASQLVLTPSSGLAAPAPDRQKEARASTLAPPSAPPEQLQQRLADDWEASAHTLREAADWLARKPCKQAWPRYQRLVATRASRQQASALQTVAEILKRTCQRFAPATPTESSLMVRVRDAGGRPLSNARVRFGDDLWLTGPSGNAHPALGSGRRLTVECPAGHDPPRQVRQLPRALLDAAATQGALLNGGTGPELEMRCAARQVTTVLAVVVEGRGEVRVDTPSGEGWTRGGVLHLPVPGAPEQPIQLTAAVEQGLRIEGEEAPVVMSRNVDSVRLVRFRVGRQPRRARTTPVRRARPYRL